MNAFTFELRDAREFQTARRKRTHTTRNQNCLCAVRGLVCRDDNLAIDVFKRDALFFEADSWVILQRLLGKLTDQILRKDFSEPSNIVDVLFRIQRGELTTQLWKRIDDFGLHLPKPGIESTKEAGGAATDNCKVVEFVFHSFATQENAASRCPGLQRCAISLAGI